MAGKGRRVRPGGFLRAGFDFAWRGEVSLTRIGLFLARPKCIGLYLGRERLAAAWTEADLRAMAPYGANVRISCLNTGLLISNCHLRTSRL